MNGLKLIFMGTPDFAVPALKALLNANHTVVAVYTQPPRPSGRGEKVRKSPVHLYAEANGIPVHTPKSLKSEACLSEFKAYNADAVVVVAYGMILPQPILDTPPMGCLNIHASLLPRWRGAAPIQRAIEAGDKESGVTIMQMDAGLDTGDMLLQQSVPIDKSTTAATLHDTLSHLGAKMVVDTLRKLQLDELQPTPQPDEGVTYASKLQREESLVDWTLPASQIEHKLRAFTPWPGLYFQFQGSRIKILEAEVISSNQADAGEVLDETLTIACGENALRILKLQKEGKKPIDTAAFLNGTPLPPGTQLRS